MKNEKIKVKNEIASGIKKKTNIEDQAKLKKLILNVTKVIVVLLLAGVVTYLTDNFHYFEHLQQGVEYGIWHGFPLPFYFDGYHINWGQNPGEPIADWNKLQFWRYQNLALDYLIYALFIGGTLFLIEKGLKKLLKIEW